MIFSKSELSRRSDEARPLLERLKGAGCHFAQMEMPDNNGRLRGKIVPLANALSAAGSGQATLTLAFKSGDHLCLSTQLSNWDNGFAKMVAVPDLSTAVVLPWKSNVAAVLYDFYMDDGSPCPIHARHILRSAETVLAQLNYSTRVALEYEFYIVEQNDALMRQKRFAELNSFGRGWDLYSISRSPSFEELAKEFMSRCEAANIPIEAFHAEFGHGMFEYTFAPQTALKAADDGVRAKLYLKQLCAERGLAACFMAAKAVGTGDSLSGCHHNFSLARNGVNAFWDEAAGELSEVARFAAAGIIETMPAFNIIYRPWVNSYRRMNHRLWNPVNASWGKENHTAALRVVHGSVPDKLTRFEHRAPGADVDPYLSIASLLWGCIRGIQERQEPPAYANGDAMRDDRFALLPHTMPDAIDSFRNSSAGAAAFGATFVEHLAHVKLEEWADFIKAVDSPESALSNGPVTAWELERYFDHA